MFALGSPSGPVREGSCPAPRLPSEAPDWEINTGSSLPGSVRCVTSGHARPSLDLGFLWWDTEMLRLTHPFPSSDKTRSFGGQGRVSQLSTREIRRCLVGTAQHSCGAGISERGPWALVASL